MKKITLYSEVSYILGLLVLSFAVAMISCTGFGVSMIVAPAYILSLRFPEIFTFGQAEYVVQGVLFILFCILVKRIKPIYLTSFLTGVIYGIILDMWRVIIPAFNPDVTVPGSLNLITEILLFALGMVLTAFSVALLFRTYLYPQVYDFFVKGVSEKLHLDMGKFKIIYDVSSFAVSILLTLVLFGRIEGIGVGTVILTLFNGAVINFAGKIIDKCFDIKPAFEKLSAKFEI